MFLLNEDDNPFEHDKYDGASEYGDAYYESLEERWRFLYPWCDVLRPYIQYYDDQVTEEYRWEILYIVFKVRMPRRGDAELDEATFRKIFQKVHEAVALLAAVQRVDYEAYGFLLTNQCGIDLGVDGEQLHDAPVAAQFVLDVDVQGREIDGAVVYDLVQFCGTNQREHPSDEYVQDLSKIAALDGTLQRDKPGVDIEIPVRLDCNVISASRAYGIANILMDVAKAEKEIDAQWTAYAENTEKEEVASGTLQCKFSLEPMSADLRHIPVTPEVTEVIERLMVGNVWFSHIALAMSMHRPSTDSELVARRAFGQLVRSLFDSTRRIKEQAHIDYDIELDSNGEGSRQIGLLNLWCEATMPARDFEAMCSAMVLTQTTKKLALELEINGSDLTNREHWWKWIAYSLFSKRARACSSLETIVLSGLGRLTAADVRAFNSVLTSDHPEEEVLGTRPGKVASRDATLQTGAPIRWHFDDEDHYIHDSHTLTYDFPVPFVRTFSDDGENEWVNVLVPGLGRCQVQRSNLVFQDPVEVEDNPAGLISLTLHFMSDEMASLNESSLPLLFEAIGPSLKSLTLNGPPGTIRQALDDNAIIRCCPNLLKLTLKRALIHVQLDFSEYRASDTPIPELTFAWLDVAAFAKALSDPSNPLARFAQRLRVSLNAFIVPPIEEEDDDEWDFPLHVNALVRMLEANQRLEYFELKSPHFNCLEEIMKFHRKPIYRQHKSLPIKCKTAFLSVVTSQRTVELKKRKAAEAHNVPVIPELHAHVTANIFSFAAVSVLRRAHYDSKQAIHFHHHH